MAIPHKVTQTGIVFTGSGVLTGFTLRAGHTPAILELYDGGDTDCQIVGFAEATSDRSTNGPNKRVPPVEGCIHAVLSGAGAKAIVYRD